MEGVMFYAGPEADEIEFNVPSCTMEAMEPNGMVKPIMEKDQVEGWEFVMCDHIPPCQTITEIEEIQDILRQKGMY